MPAVDPAGPSVIAEAPPRSGVERDVEANQVHQLERPGGHAKIELEHSVNVLRPRHPVRNHRQRFTFDRGPHPVEDEAYGLFSCLERVDAKLRQDSKQGVEQAAVCLTVRHQVERRDLRRHIKVRVAQSSFIPHALCHQTRRIRRRVGREDGVRRREPVDLAPKRNLDLEFLGGGLHGEPRVVQRLCQRYGGGRDAWFAEAAVLDDSREGFGNILCRRNQLFLPPSVDPHGSPTTGKHQRDPPAQRSGPDHCNRTATDVLESVCVRTGHSCMLGRARTSGSVSKHQRSTDGCPSSTTSPLVGVDPIRH
jgi:hypothetical protein